MDLAPISDKLWNVDSPKAIKSRKYGALNAILYMAPHTMVNAGNLCPNASPGCVAACLGVHSGQASMVANNESMASLNNVRRSRINKARHFQKNRAAFMRAMVLQLAREYARAVRLGFELIARPNGSTDIAFEAVKVDIDAKTAARITKLVGRPIEARVYRNIFEVFPFVRFNDYTKSAKRVYAFLRGELPANYHLTFSRSEANETDARAIANSGGNVAVVFDALPTRFYGRDVIDGDAHDLRCTDPAGVIVGLTPKGAKPKKDASGFIVRLQS